MGSALSRSGIRGLVDDEQAARQNLVDADPLWLRPCLAYNLQIAVASEPAQRLWEAVAGPAESEPALLICPPVTYHLSVLNLLPARDPDIEAKERVWRTSGSRWVELAELEVRRHSRYEIRLSSLVATKSALIAAAVDSPATVELRSSLSRCLGLGLGAIPELTHVTLARYRGALSAPHRLLDQLARTQFEVLINVDCLRLVRERVYPSIDLDLIAELQLAQAR
jgi:hypothetical protein